MAYSVNEEMVASYSVTIDGVERTKRELAKLDGTIARLRSTTYSPAAPNVTIAGQLGGGDILVTKITALEGRVQAATQSGMAKAMAHGRRTQTAALNAAETETGRNRPGGSAGRNKTGSMIHAIATNVETFKGGTFTIVTGWHGWGRLGRKHYEWQERGTKGKGGDRQANAGLSRAPNKRTKRFAGQRGRSGGGVPAANALGLSIPVVREFLKRELGKLR